MQENVVTIQNATLIELSPFLGTKLLGLRMNAIKDVMKKSATTTVRILCTKKASSYLKKFFYKHILKQ